MSAPLWRRKRKPAPRCHFHDATFWYVSPLDLSRIQAKAVSMSLFLASHLNLPLVLPSTVEFCPGNTAMYLKGPRKIILGGQAIIFHGFSEDFHLIHELIHGYYPDTGSLLDRAGEDFIKSLEHPALKVWYVAIGKLPSLETVISG